jgi:uncharacterized membrane protein YjgN (DUF898 family)
MHFYQKGFNKKIKIKQYINKSTNVQNLGQTYHHRPLEIWVLSMLTQVFLNFVSIINQPTMVQALPRYS